MSRSSVLSLAGAEGRQEGAELSLGCVAVLGRGSVQSCSLAQTPLEVSASCIAPQEEQMSQEKERKSSWDPPS